MLGGASFSSAWRCVAASLSNEAVAWRPDRMRNLLVQHADAAEQARQQAQLARTGRRLVDARLAVERAELASRTIGALRRAQHEESVRVERIVERFARQLLQFAIQVDQNVAADDEIEPRERRVLEQAVTGEQHQIA